MRNESDQSKEAKKKDPELLGNYIYQQLRECIMCGELKPGVRLIVLDLSQKYGVSQAPVREALSRLRQDGLIIGKDNKGSVVSEISLVEVEELYELRQLIEGYAVRETLKNMKQKNFDYLEKIYDGMKQAGIENDLTKFINLDMKFHDFFYENCNNRAILNVWTHIKVQLIRFMFVSNQIYFSNIEEVADYHIELLSALRLNDTEQIEKLFIDHMKVVWWRIKKRTDQDKLLLHENGE
jgi:DNA-binding GntR family transcriptional regulator